MKLDESLGSELHPPGFHGSLPKYLGQIWERRQYLWYVPVGVLKGQNNSTILGSFWLLLNPILSIAVYFLVFGVILSTDRGVENFITFLAVGVFLFQFTQRATIEGSKCLVRNRGLMRTLSFPRALLPLTEVIVQVLAVSPGIVVIVVTAVLTGETPRVAWLALPIVALSLAVMTTGLACIAARANHTYRDVQNLLPFAFRLAFYASGVLFSANAYLDDPAVRWLFAANPIYGYIEIGRWSILGSQVESNVIVLTALWTVVLPVAGFMWFRGQEASYGS